MTKQSDIGYRLDITYNAKQKKYYLTGDAAYLTKTGQIKYSQDGATLTFDSLESALKHIQEYKDKQ